MIEFVETGGRPPKHARCAEAFPMKLRRHASHAGERAGVLRSKRIAANVMGHPGRSVETFAETNEGKCELKFVDGPKFFQMSIRSV
jgi:hypothetical protein